MESTSDKLTKFREVLKAHNIDAYIVPHNDQHDSEYIASCDERLAFITGFTGSAGFGFASTTQALMWTDSRYYLQAEKELLAGWKLRQSAEPGVKPWYDHVLQTYSSGFRVGYDPQLIDAASSRLRSLALKNKGIELVAIDENLVDKLWTDKPKQPQDKVFIHPIEYIGVSVQQKFEQIGQKVKEKGGTSHITAKLDEIAWALNLRGSDIDYNPVFKSYLHIFFNFENGNHTAILYINPSKVPEQVVKYLKDFHVQVRDYPQVFQDLTTHTTGKIFIKESNANTRLFSQINSANLLSVPEISPIERLKGVKNPRELQGFEECHVRDAAAVCMYIAWLENELVTKQNSAGLTEHSAAEHLGNLRKSLPLNKGLSFPSISSIGANGAIVHYHADEVKSEVLDAAQVYLIDSGGQYWDGTTDITRTWHFTNPTAEQADAFTRVLLGNLDIERVIWPEKNKIAGSDLDALARRHLWQNKMDYGHGTGHGVGYFLNVHEGPHGISKFRTEPLVDGMIVSNEPGYYKAGSFGIRIENLVIVQSKGDGYLGFQNLTVVPYDRNMIDKKLLAPADVDYINQYHELVFKLVSPYLEERKDTLALEWLKRKCAPL